MQPDDTTGKILIVDDNPSNVKILEERLDAYELRTACSGEAALAVAPEFHPDVVLLDIMMPGIDGYEVCRRMRSHPDLADTKIIMVTAKALREERLDGYAAGADDYVVKPFDGQELQAKVRVYLRLKSTEEFNRRLTADVEARTRDYRLAKEAAEKANQAKNRFIAVMTHELRNPLTSILGWASMLRGRPPQGADEQALSALDSIIEGANYLSALVADIFDVVKIDRDVVELQVDRFPADIFLRTAVDMVRGQAEAKGLVLTVAVDPALSHITCDRRRCTQVLTNLLTNAAKYTAPGGRIEVEAERELHGGARIRVRDTGVGISEEAQQNLFTEFYQVDRERDEQLGGTGIGLALARRLVQLHGGEIGVNSVVGEGSTFWFTLPWVDGAAEAVEAPADPMLTRLPSVAGRRVLVADDSRSGMAVLIDLLDRCDLKVVTATNGAEAVELTRYHHPELVLMDLRMPVLDGFEAVQRIRAIPEFATTPIVALSGTTDPDSVQRALQAGCNEHVAKPVDAQTVLDLVSRYLGPTQ